MTAGPTHRAPLLFAAGALVGALAGAGLALSLRPAPSTPTAAVAAPAAPASASSPGASASALAARAPAADPGEVASSVPAAQGAPAQASSPEAAGPEALARAASGDLDAIKSIEARDERQRSVAEAVAIASGHASLARRDLASLSGAIEREPALARDRATLARFHDFIEREPVAIEALAAVARLPGPDAPDLLFAAWRRHRHSITGLLARDLARRQQSLDQATEALRVAIELELLLEQRPARPSQVERRCERARALLDRVASSGDRRCSPLLAELGGKRGCGADAQADCFACLRGDDALARASDAAQRREAPAPWVLPRMR